jgi:7-cyano-7-deazaguanine synthase
MLKSTCPVRPSGVRNKMIRDSRSDRKKTAVSLLSGGLDSVVSLAAAHAEMEVRLVLFADYRQRAVERERSAAVGVATFYQLPFIEVDVGWLGDLSPPGMQARASALREPPRLEETENVWIPNRNGVLLNVAAAFAESRGCDMVVTGFNREEAGEFPDNRADYVSAVNEAFKFSTRNGVRVTSYTQDLDKRGILELGAGLGAPLSLIWSCYDGGALMCGRCASCRRLKAGLDALPPDCRPPVRFAV